MKLQTVNLRRKAEALTSLAREITFTADQCGEAASLLEEALLVLSELCDRDSIQLGGQETTVRLARKFLTKKAELLRVVQKANYRASIAGGQHALRHL